MAEAPLVAQETKFHAIHLDCIRVDSVVEFDLFIKVKNTLVLYRSADLPFTERTRQKLLDNKVDRLFISNANRSKYQRYIERNLSKVLEDPHIPQQRKAAILYETSTDLVKDVFTNPTYGDNIRRSHQLVQNTIGYILQGQEAFHQLLQITSFDYYTYTHSVNVCVFSIALAQQVGLSDEELLRQLGMGALLHDVGKSRISSAILNKRTALTPQEFDIMKKHPKWGVDMLSESDELTDIAFYPVLQHHERGDRGGYPNGLNLDEMHETARVVAICDTFDAMTTERVYQRALDTYDVLKMMMAMKGMYDESMLRSFIELMGPHGLQSG